MKKYISWRELVFAAVTACVFLGGPALAQAANDDGGAYWTSSDGAVYTDSTKDCWQSPNVPKGELRAECGDKVATGPADSDHDGVIDANDECPGTPRGTEVDARGCPIEKQAPIVLKGVTFKFDKSTLTQQAESRLDNVINALDASSGVDFRIDGYTDSVGSDRYNQGLSQRRVDSVRAYLLSHGISSSRITGTQGHGESNPVASNKTAAGRAQNRRVELNVSSQ